MEAFPFNGVMLGWDPFPQTPRALGTCGNTAACSRKSRTTLPRAGPRLHFWGTDVFPPGP